MRCPLIVVVALWMAACTAGKTVDPSSPPAVRPPPAPKDDRQDPELFRKRILASRAYQDFYLGGEYVIVLRAEDVLAPAVADRIERLTRDLLEFTPVQRVESLANRPLYSARNDNLMISSAARELENEIPRDQVAETIQHGSHGRPVVNPDHSRTMVYVYRSDLQHGQRLLEVARKVVPDLKPAGYDLSRPPRPGDDALGDPLDLVGAVHVLLSTQAGGDVLDVEALACLEKLEAAARAHAPCQPTSLLDPLRIVHGLLAGKPAQTPSKMPGELVRQMALLASMSGDPGDWPTNHDRTRTVMTVPVRHGSAQQRTLARHLRSVHCEGYRLSVQPGE